MAARRRNHAGTIGQINTATIVICAVVVLAVIGIGVYIGTSRRPTVARAAAPDWVQQKATECQGDMSKLSMDDQQRLISMYGLPGAPSRIANVYRSIKGDQ